MPAEVFHISQLPGVILQLLAGLGLFLFGMNTMSEGLERVAGKQLKNLLGTVTQNRFLQVLLGFVITVLMQSSSATTVMLVGFVNAGIMQLAQAVGIIMGANIGTTVTVLMMSIKLDFHFIFCFVGCILLFLPAQFKKLKGVMPVIFGLGALFIGMKFMSGAMEPLRSWVGFTNALKAVQNPVVAVLIGAGITALIQSSAASIAILLPLAEMGFIDFKMCMFILCGQNIGTCVTAVLACMGASATSKRVACVHLLFNVIGTVVFVVFACILPVDQWIVALVNTFDAGNISMQITVTHIIFNSVTTLLLLPFCTQLEKLACLIIRDDGVESEAMKLLHFDQRMLMTPAVAAEQLFNEVQRMGTIALSNFNKAMECFNEWSDEKSSEVMRNEEVLDFLNKEITTCLVEVKGLDLDERDTRLVGSLFHVVNDMERVGDHAQNILEAATLRQQEDIKFSPKAIQELDTLSEMVSGQLELAMKNFRDQLSGEDARKVVEETEQQIDDMTEALRQHHVDRLKQHKCSAKNGMIYLDILTNLERIGDHAENIATSVDKATVHLQA
ncbi:MAG: Na/Pi cotransporter family protein [Clostridiales bacterium]|nr:Na/Pi cotransporter family protein [Clostridiales bacterium]